MVLVTKAEYKIGTEIRGKVGKQADAGKNPHFGIYQMRDLGNGKVPFKMKFYKPTNPRTALQQLNRQNFKNACLQWQALDEPTKVLWREKAKPKRIFGFNLFLKWFMLK